MTLKNTIELGLLANLVAAGGKSLTPSEVAAKLPSAANPVASDMVDTMLRLLASVRRRARVQTPRPQRGRRLQVRTHVSVLADRKSVV